MNLKTFRVFVGAVFIWLAIFSFAFGVLVAVRAWDSTVLVPWSVIGIISVFVSYIIAPTRLVQEHKAERGVAT